MVTSFEFIVSDPVKDPKPGKSSQIRSRCMRGRNKREGSRRSKREEKRVAKQAQARAEAAEEPHGASPMIELPLLEPQLSSLALMQPAGTAVGWEAKGLVVKAFAYDITNKSLEPLSRLVDFASVERTPFEWVFTDAAYSHSLLCTSYAMNDFVLPEWEGWSAGPAQVGQKTLVHLRETLMQLQSRMGDEHALQNDALLHSILNLVLLSIGWTDRNAALAHFSGLQAIVRLRGDLDFLSTRPKLHFKLERLDLIWTLSSGQPSIFGYFGHPITTWSLLFPDPHPNLAEEAYMPPPYWDYRLVNVFLDFQYFAADINQSVKIRSSYEVSHFQSVMSSLQQRLLYLREELSDPMEELVCLAMLAILSMFFRVPGRRVPYAGLAKQVVSTYARMADADIKQERLLFQWILLTFATAITNLWLPEVRNAWEQMLQDAWGNLVQSAWTDLVQEPDWDAFKHSLRQVIWVDIILDETAEAAFNQMCGADVQRSAK